MPPNAAQVAIISAANLHLREELEERAGLDAQGAANGIQAAGALMHQPAAALALIAVNVINAVPVPGAAVMLAQDAANVLWAVGALLPQPVPQLGVGEPGAAANAADADVPQIE